MKAGLRRRGVRGDCSPRDSRPWPIVHDCEQRVRRRRGPPACTGRTPDQPRTHSRLVDHRMRSQALRRWSRVRRLTRPEGRIRVRQHPATAVAGRGGAMYTRQAWTSDQRHATAEAHVSGTLPAMAKARLCAPRLPFVASHPSPKRLPDADLGCRTAGVDRSSQVLKPHASFTQRPANRDARKGPAARVAGLACLS
jgi:hypothetical protein